MKIRKVVRTAMNSLTRNVARSTLTVLGIVIGIAAVIVMMEIGKGSSAAIAKTIESTGANNLLVMPGTASSGGVTFGAGSILTLTSEDCEAIRRECPAVLDASPIVRTRTQVVYQDRNWVPSYIYGVNTGYLTVRGWKDLEQGEAFTDTDVRNASRVCLVGRTVVRELLQESSPIGKEIRLQNISFRVVGVLTPKGANAFGQDQDDIILAPWTTIKYRVASGSTATPTQTAAATTTNGNSIYPGAASLYPVPSAMQLADQPSPVHFANVDQIIAAGRTSAETPDAIQQITVLLRQRHNTRPDEASDFNIRDMTESASALASTTDLMTKLLLSVALISLVVGGVGIMNIMLVSVTERTREIGLRMAVGARARDVLTQFLIEAMLLCLMGGALGLAFGRAGSFAVATFLRWPVEASPSAIVASIVVSALVGVVFGFYPAWKASRLDPIDALRYE